MSPQRTAPTVCFPPVFSLRFWFNNVGQINSTLAVLPEINVFSALISMSLVCAEQLRTASGFWLINAHLSSFKIIKIKRNNSHVVFPQTEDFIKCKGATVHVQCNTTIQNRTDVTSSYKKILYHRYHLYFLSASVCCRRVCSRGRMARHPV